MNQPQIVRTADGRMTIVALGGVTVTAQNVGLLGDSGGSYEDWNLPEPTTEPVYTPDQVRQAQAALADPNNPAYAANRKFTTPGGRYEGLTAEQRMAMEQMEAQMEVGAITDLGEYNELKEVPSDMRTRLAGSIAGDDAKELAAMMAYDEAELAGEDPVIAGLTRLRNKPLPPIVAPRPTSGGTIYD